MENNLLNKAKFFAQYWGQEVLSGESETIHKLNAGDMAFGIQSYWLELKPLSTISDEDAFAVARILHGESDKFAIEFNAEGLTSVAPYGLPCYHDTVDINWSGSLFYERTSSLKYLEAFDFLRSKGYALPYIGLSVDKLQEYGWIKLKSE